MFGGVGGPRCWRRCRRTRSARAGRPASRARRSMSRSSLWSCCSRGLRPSGPRPRPLTRRTRARGLDGPVQVEIAKAGPGKLELQRPPLLRSCFASATIRLHSSKIDAPSLPAGTTERQTSTLTSRCWFDRCWIEMNPAPWAASLSVSGAERRPDREALCGPHPLGARSFNRPWRAEQSNRRGRHRGGGRGAP